MSYTLKYIAKFRKEAAGFFEDNGLAHRAFNAVGAAKYPPVGPGPIDNAVAGAKSMASGAMNSLSAAGSNAMNRAGSAISSGVNTLTGLGREAATGAKNWWEHNPVATAGANAATGVKNWWTGNPEAKNIQATQATSTALDAANTTFGPGTHPGLAQEIAGNQPKIQAQNPLDRAVPVKWETQQDQLNKQTVANAGSLVNAGTKPPVQPSPTSPPGMLASAPKRQINEMGSIKMAPSPASSPASAPAAPRPAAPAGGGASQAYWGSLFKKYHGTAYNPNSAMDKLKMDSMIKARSSGGSMLTAANVTGPKAVQGWRAGGKPAVPAPAMGAPAPAYVAR